MRTKGVGVAAGPQQAAEGDHQPTLTGTATAAMLPMCATGQAMIATRTSAACQRCPSRASAAATSAKDSGKNSPSGLIRFAAPGWSTREVSPSDRWIASKP